MESSIVSTPISPEALLAWYIEMGVDEAIGDEPVDRLAPPAVKPTIAAPPPSRPSATVSPLKALAPHPSASALAAQAKSLAELRHALEVFEDCPLKKTATNLVFGDGNPEAKIMFIGEAPGADEDRIGLPFVGQSGKLLDKMLFSIGLDRSNYYITNILPWRPPGNRTPTPAEIAACLPFVERHVELVDPDLLILLGGSSASALLARHEGIGKLRGKWHEYETPGLSRPLPTFATFHPAYLLRSPAQKRDAWKDLLAIKAKLAELGLKARR
jgi:uracil-DNA glycosylase family 4